MNKHIQPKNALISVFYKDGLAPIVEQLNRLGINIYSTGGTQKFIEELSNEIPDGIETTNIKTIVTIHDLIFVRYPNLFNSFDMG